MNTCYCLVAFVLFFSTAFTFIFVKAQHNKFELTLDNTQKVKYESIRKERLYIYMFATLIGTIVGFTNRHNTCIAIASALSVQLIVYKIFPKSDFMLNHLKNENQIKAWVQKYTFMNNLSNYGIVFGILLFTIYYYLSDFKTECNA